MVGRIGLLRSRGRRTEQPVGTGPEAARCRCRPGPGPPAPPRRFPLPAADHGRPALRACRSRWRRYLARLRRRQALREDRTEALCEPRHELRAAAYRTAVAARALAALVDAEEARGEGEMEDRHWRSERAAALYTRAARTLAESAEDVLAAAVRAGRTAGGRWTAVGRALDVSADTAARRHGNADTPASPVGPIRTNTSDPS